MSKPPPNKLSSKLFHIAMFPWFASGHMTPFLHLSNNLAQRGHKISFLLPKKAQLQLEPLNLFPNLITFHTIVVPGVEGLPPGAETASDVHLDGIELIVIAMDRTRDQVKSILSSIRPDFVFFDFSHWIPEVVRSIDISIKTVNYIIVSAISIAFGLVPARHIPKDRPLTEEDMSLLPIGYPSSKAVLRGREIRSLISFLSLSFGEEGLTFYGRNTAAMGGADALAIRTCQELEGNMCAYISSQYNKPVFLTGPVLTKQEGKLENRWANWLDHFEPGSVVFVAFGSQFVLEKNQFQELLLGLEETNYPFLVALKPPSGSATIEDALPDGFRERVGGRGVVCGEWVPQPLILEHKSVGCFVTHAGFGSTWEGLMSDKQIVFVPQLGEQILNTRLMCEELKVGVEVERDEENGWFTREGVREAIKSVMEKESEVGVRVKENHEKWRETFTNPGFMSGYIDKFVQDLHDLKEK